MALVRYQSLTFVNKLRQVCVLISPLLKLLVQQVFAWFIASITW